MQKRKGGMCFSVFEIERKRAVVACRQFNLGLCSFVICKLFVECDSYMNQKKTVIMTMAYYKKSIVLTVSQRVAFHMVYLVKLFSISKCLSINSSFITSDLKVIFYV